MRMHKTFLITILFFIGAKHSQAQALQTQKAVIKVDFREKISPMRPVWAWFGYDEPNYTYMKDGKKLLSELSALSPVPVYVRTHSLLVTGDGTAALKWGSTNAYTEDANGNPVYSWKLLDSIFDTYIKRGMKPLAQIGFMPEALTTNNTKPYHHHWKPGDPYSDIVTGWAYPPKDYNKWRELVYQWVKHCVERYGRKEVQSWYWEVWNEPNGSYWRASREEYFKLYDYATDGVKRALPTARIGGLNVAGTGSKGGREWLTKFLEHCISGTNYATGKIGAPLDVVLFHAKGQPKFVDGHVVMNMAPQLNDIKTGFEIVSSFKATKRLPIIIGESDPEGCAACGMATNPENAYRNGTMYSSYTAASFAREYALAKETGVNFLGAVSWSFEFENQPWFYGYRDLATNGVDKPILNVFRMFGKMGGELVKVSSNRAYSLDSILNSGIRGNQTDIGGLASINGHTAALMTWNYHDAEEKGNPEEIAVQLAGIPAKAATLSIYMIDHENSNAYTAWQQMGSPQSPTPQQIALLEKAGQLKRIEKLKIQIHSGKTTLRLNIERQAVALVIVEW